MHIRRVTFLPETYPRADCYPFNLRLFQDTAPIEFRSPVTFFVGENGSGKTTLLEAMARKCGIHIWENGTPDRILDNPYEKMLYQFLTVKWTNGYVNGAFFSGEMFRDFSRNLEEWSVSDPALLDYFGGKSLLAQSHGQSLLSYFKSRYRIKGLYFLDEPETALSPRSQLELLKVLMRAGAAGHAQFVIVTHSPILLGCPSAELYDFDGSVIVPIDYEKTGHYQIYKNFMACKEQVLDAI